MFEKLLKVTFSNGSYFERMKKIYYITKSIVQALIELGNNITMLSFF